MRPFTPRPYQEIATQFLLDTPRCALWMDMGMGKTVSTLTALNALRLAEDNVPLILAPLRVARGTWPREAEKWSHLIDYKISAIVGNAKQREAALRTRADAYTLNYENLPWLFEYLEAKGVDWPFRTVVADEATRLKSMRPTIRKHHATGKEFVQNQGAKRARQLARAAHYKIDRFLELTGTPAPLGLKDLWGQLWFVDAGARLGRTHDDFMQRWFRAKHDGYGSEELPFAEAQIHDKIRDVCLSIRAEDWFDLQKPLVMPVYIDLPPKVRRIYREMEKQMFAEIEGTGVEAFNAAARTNKCLQLAAGFIYDNPEDDNPPNPIEVHDEKLQALESIAYEADGHPLLIQYHYKPDLRRILKKFPDARQLKTQQDEDDWNAGKISKLVAHADSCGHGLNLQDGGHILVRYSYWWAREAFDQILERIGPVRQAQAGRSVVVREYRIIARDTVDEDVLVRHETNRAVEDVLMEAMVRRAT